MNDRTSRGDYQLDVRRLGEGGDLSVALRDGRGDVIHHQKLPHAGDEARAVYEGLMTALDVAQRYECGHLAVHFSPGELVDLVRDRPHEARELSPVEAALRRWTLHQLRGFGSVTLLGTQAELLRYGPASLNGHPPLPGHRFGRA